MSHRLERTERLSLSPSTQGDLLEEEGRAVQLLHTLGLVEGGSVLVLGLLLLSGAADTENQTQAHEGTPRVQPSRREAGTQLSGAALNRSAVCLPGNVSVRYQPPRLHLGPSSA